MCSLCLEDKGNKLHLLTLSNRELNLSPKRALLISETTINISVPREQLLNRLMEIEARRKGHQQEVQVRELWELVRDENERFRFTYLTKLCFGEEITDDHVSALVRALFHDRLYFKLKEGNFIPNTEKRVEQILKQREEEALREERLSHGSIWLKTSLANGAPGESPYREETIGLLIDLALYGTEARNYKEGRELITRAGVPDISEARKILVTLGIWDSDENLDLLRLDIRSSFDDKLLREAESYSGREVDTAGLEDLRHLDIMTIDGPATKDFDDALSLEMEGDTLNLGIHITDVAGVIFPEDILDREAAHRASSLYLPFQQIPMLPPELSQGVLSLKQDCDRGAISLLSRFDKYGNLLDYRLVPSLISVRRQLTYDHVNERYREDRELAEMYRLSQTMRKKRIDQGSLVLSLPEANIRKDSQGNVSIRMLEQDSPSRTIVAEFMIYYNWMIATFCHDNNIPTLYRCQEEPLERVDPEGKDQVYFVFEQRRKLQPLMVGTEPGPHRGLGLDGYTNVSSPIRRYLDLVVQRQIRGFLLEGKPYYKEEELEQIRMNVGPVIKSLDRVRFGRTRYWLQKYLGQHKGEVFPAFILYPLRSKYRLVLTDILLMTEMDRVEGEDFTGGQHVMVRIKKADPWNDRLQVEYAGRAEDS
ncbi:ribonuclease catalytic domain-containing protein [Thermodesulfobacteriota bacterium]